MNIKTFLPRVKLALALGIFAYTVPMALRLNAGETCGGCGDYRGYNFQVGDCWMVDTAAICDGGVCTISYMNCGDPDQNPEDYKSCSCEPIAQ